MRKEENKKSQQEIVGFIIIVLMVVIAGVIFLSISLRPQKAVFTDSADLSNFLIAGARFTTDCYISSVPGYQNLEDLTRSCASNPLRKCDDGRNVCEVLNSSYNGILNKIWLTSEVGAIKYYSLNIFYQLNLTDPSTKKLPGVLTITSGKTAGCLTRIAGQNPLSIDSGFLVTQIEICKGA